MGLRMCQLTYNLGTLVGDGCTEIHKSGLTYFGQAVVQRLNELNIIVDVSHCSEQVGWDADGNLHLACHRLSLMQRGCRIPRQGQERRNRQGDSRTGRFFGVVIIPGFIQTSTEATLDDFVDHVIHLVDVMGIDTLASARQGRAGAGHGLADSLAG